MIFHFATGFLPFSGTACLSFGPKLLEQEPTFTAASLLASSLFTLFRRQIPAALLPAARNRLALGFQFRHPSRTPRLHGGKGAGHAVGRRRPGRTAAVKTATLAAAYRPIPAAVAGPPEIFR
jgi:hypothetical protein